MIQASTSLQDRLRELLAYLGITQAHFAGRLPSDWIGLVTKARDLVSSLTLVGAAGAPEALRALEEKLLVVGGDRGPLADRTRAVMTELHRARFVLLRDYNVLAWSDITADRGEEVGTAMLEFLAQTSGSCGLRNVSFPKTEGVVADISYRIRGNGPPLVLLPQSLAPSQWEPLVPRLAERYSVITLGGIHLGVVALLEARGRASGYLHMMRTLIDESRVTPNESVLDVGSGTGVLARWLARHTRESNPILGVDINRYLLDEATAIVRNEALSGCVTFREGSAEALPLADDSIDVTLSVTVIEEVDARRMLDEMVRVTKRGGRVAVVARALDLPFFWNVRLRPALRAKVDAPGAVGAVGPHGCADASLYDRFHAAGLRDVKMFPHATPFSVADRSVVDYMQEYLLAKLDAAEAEEWKVARAEAERSGVFVVAWPHHCAVGTKP